MRVRIFPDKAKGSITAPPSKSMAHRLLLCAAMSEGKSVISGMSDCDDVLATLDCLETLGVKWEMDGDTVTVWGRDMRTVTPTAALACRESGSTLRFMLPICLVCGKNVMMTGAPSLMRRPMSIYEEISREFGYTYLLDGTSIVLRGPLRSGEYKIAGDVSSQFISGLLFALPLLDGDSKISITPPVVSRSYLDLTVMALRLFGIEVEWSDDHTIFIRGSQHYRATDVRVEGDYSGASFFAALRVLGGEVEIGGLDPASLQGDRIYEKYFGAMACGIPTIHIGNCPDLGPILMALAAAKHGGIFTGTSRLKIKESDRGAAMARELAKFGASVTVHEDSIVVYPADFHAPTEVLCGYGDHRIVMSLAVLLTLVGGEIDGAEAIKKSYPAFFDDLASLGVKIEITE